MPYLTGKMGELAALHINMKKMIIAIERIVSRDVCYSVEHDHRERIYEVYPPHVSSSPIVDVRWTSPVGRHGGQHATHSAGHLPTQRREPGLGGRDRSERRWHCMTGSAAVAEVIGENAVSTYFHYYCRAREGGDGSTGWWGCDSGRWHHERSVTLGCWLKIL